MPPQTAGLPTASEPFAPTNTPGDGGVNAGLSFGAAMERLDEIVAQLEGNESLELESAIVLWERGKQIAAECDLRLTAAQLKLTQIAPGTASDDPGVTPGG